MADEVDQQVAKAILAGQGSKRGGMLWAIIAVAAIGVAAGAGLGVGRFARPAQAGPASEESPDPKEESVSPSPRGLSDGPGVARVGASMPRFAVPSPRPSYVARDN